jgi:hypothetical protein
VKDPNSRSAGWTSGGSPGACILVLALTALNPASRVSGATAPATLGAAPEVFAAAFGKPLQDNGTVKSYGTCPGSESGAKWGIVFGISSNPKGGFLHQAAAIERHACGSERLDTAAAKKGAVAMMPPDAKPVREFDTPDGRRAQEYRSLSLGKALGADHFLGCTPDGKTAKVPEGTFSFAPSKDGHSWDIILGTCF